MCPGNRAPATTFYVNSQFDTLWQLAQKCVEKHGKGVKASSAEVAYGTCLAQFGVGKHRVNRSTDDLTFFASFAAPKITFICNHDVLVEFKLESGHVKYDAKGYIERFANYFCAFRVPFRQQYISDTVNSFKARFLILDFNAATLVHELSRFENQREVPFNVAGAINRYIRDEYLPLLHKAGLHCVHSLPEYDVGARIKDIDFSIDTKTSEEWRDILKIHVTTVYGFSIELVNTTLKGRWLQDAGYIDELEVGHGYTSQGQFLFVEHRAVCDDFHFHAHFGPPQIVALCSTEIVFTVDVQELHLYLGGAFTEDADHVFSKWKIAIVVGISSVEGGLHLDFSRARYCEALSHFESSESILEEFHTIRTSVIQYICTRYVSSLEQFHYCDIHTISTIVDIDDISSEEYVETHSDYWRERLSITETFGFDFLTSITQGSLNYYLRCLWKASSVSVDVLSSWAFQNFFKASFLAPQIQLPCDPNADYVILYLTLKDGSLSILDHFRHPATGHEHAFANWRLAFEVKLRTRVLEKFSPVTEFLHKRESVGKFEDWQLYLDFSTAKFRQELSRLPSLFEDDDFLLMREKRKALIYYIKTQYFTILKSKGYHVLYTVPMWKPHTCGIIPYAPSWFNFQFYGALSEKFESVSALFGPNHVVGNRNMIVICGMVDAKNRPPFPLPRCSWRWDNCEHPFSGTVVLSRSVFLDSWLLSRLEVVNLRTTLIPIFEGFEDLGKWKFHITTLENYVYRSARSSAWKEVASHNHCLEFQHKHKDVWTYEHTGDSYDVYNGGYSAHCETVNTLLLPTVATRGGCEIVISGEVTLSMNFTGVKKAWSTSAAASWSTTLVMKADEFGGGLVFSQLPTINYPSASSFSGDYDIAVRSSVTDAGTLLRTHLSKIDDIIDGVILDLKSTFSGVWPLLFSGAHGYTLCDPVFNSHGDICFDLQSPVDNRGVIIVSSTERRDLFVPIKISTNVIRSNGNTPVSSPRGIKRPGLIQRVTGAVNSSTTSFFESASVSSLSSLTASTKSQTSITPLSVMSTETLIPEHNGNGNGNGVHEIHKSYEEESYADDLSIQSSHQEFHRSESDVSFEGVTAGN